MPPPRGKRHAGKQNTYDESDLRITKLETLVLADEGTVRSEASRCAPAATQPPERSFAARAAEEPDRVVVLGGIDQAAAQRVVSAAALRRAPAEPSPAASAEEEPGDARVIFLGGTVDGRRSPAGSMQVFKEE